MSANAKTDIEGRIDLPVYPKAFVAAARLNRERDRIFVAMPFSDKHSEALWKILKSVGDIHGLKVRRGDTATYPNPVVSNILEELERAECIIADLTGLNANVLYELGIAHVRCDSVILISPQDQTLPFNLSAIRCLFYEDLRSREERVGLATRLGDVLTALKKSDQPMVIESPYERTRLIIEDLQTLASMPDQELKEQTIRFSGFLSSFAISKAEPIAPGEEDYQSLLVQERDTLLSLVDRGCQVKCIISPPTRVNWKPYRVATARERLKRMEEMLGDSTPTLGNIEWAISPFRQKNLYIIGNVSCSEGFKKGYQRGFGLTSRQTGHASIEAARLLFDALFEWLTTDTLTTYGKPGQVDKIASLREAAYKCIRQSVKYCDEIEDSNDNSVYPQNRHDGKKVKLSPRASS